MRGKLMAAAGATAIVGALIVGVGTGGAATNREVKAKISCTSQTYNQSFPSMSGLLFAAVKCSKPLGNGVQQGTFHESLTGTALTVTGAVKNYYDKGTIHGTYKLTGTVGSGPTTAAGTVTVTGGTGAYRGAKGKATTSCTTNDAGKTYRCSVTGNMTF